MYPELWLLAASPEPNGGFLINIELRNTKTSHPYESSHVILIVKACSMSILFRNSNVREIASEFLEQVQKKIN
jgi:drug/metabolite transporter superfamily protein YnfA